MKQTQMIRQEKYLPGAYANVAWKCKRKKEETVQFSFNFFNLDIQILQTLPEL